MNKKVKLFCPCAERYKIQRNQNFKLLKIIKLNLLYSSQVQQKVLFLQLEENFEVLGMHL